MNCKEAKSLLTNYLLGDLNEAQASAIRAHIETCENCNAEAAELRPTLDLLRDAFADTAPAPAKLDAGRHAAIYQSQPTRKGKVVKWVTGHYPVVRRVAAALLVCGMLGVFAKMLTPMSAYKMSESVSGADHWYARTEAQPSVEVQIMEPSALEGLEDISEEVIEPPESGSFHGGIASSVPTRRAPSKPAANYTIPKGSGASEVAAVKVSKKKRKQQAPPSPVVMFEIPDLDNTEVDQLLEEKTMTVYKDMGLNSKAGKMGKGGGRAATPGWPQGMSAGDKVGRGGAPAKSGARSSVSKEKSLDNSKADVGRDSDGLSDGWERNQNTTKAITVGGVIADSTVLNGSVAARPQGGNIKSVPDETVGNSRWSLAGEAKPASRSVKKEGFKKSSNRYVDTDTADDGIDLSGVTGDDSFGEPVDEKRKAEGDGESDGKGFLERVPLIGSLFRSEGSASKAGTLSKDASTVDGYSYSSLTLPAEVAAEISDAPIQNEGGLKGRKLAASRENKGLEVSDHRADRSRRNDPTSPADSFEGEPAPALTLALKTPPPSSGPSSTLAADVTAGTVSGAELKSRLMKMPEPARQLASADISLKKGNLAVAQTYYNEVADSIEDKKSDEYIHARLGSVEVDRISRDRNSALATLDKLQSVADESTRVKIQSARAKVLMDSEDYSGAHRELEEVLKADPANKDALIMRGKLEISMRNLVEATEIELGATGEEEDDDKDPTRFKAYGVNPVINVSQNAFSTFSIDVDTASYTLARNYIENGSLPPAEAVRTEEMVNFFDYSYKAPAHRTFAVYAEAAPSKFGRGQHILKIGVKGKRLGREEQRRAVLTFMIDTSGSMETPDRIGLVKKSLKMLVAKLNDEDLVSIVQYDSRARLVLSHTEAAKKKQINAAIDSLQCSGSTNLEQGLTKAYEAAAKGFISKGENRVLILSDGVANLGNLDAEALLAKVAQYRKQGIYCSVFGVGMGTYDDVMLETLANKGDGTYAYLDSEEEAKRLFVDDLAATLNTIARDVKIQVEFNRNLVSTYRQLGYENKQLTKEQFRDDTVDAGEVGSGQSVTALYEIEMQKVISKQIGSRRLMAEPIATVRVRYRRSDNDAVEEIEIPVTFKDFVNDFNKADARFRLAACAAEFSEILRGSPYAQGSDYRDVSKVLAPVALELNLDQRVQGFLRMTTSAPGMARGK